MPWNQKIPLKSLHFFPLGLHYYRVSTDETTLVETVLCLSSSNISIILTQCACFFVLSAACSQSALFNFSPHENNDQPSEGWEVLKVSQLQSSAWEEGNLGMRKGAGGLNPFVRCDSDVCLYVGVARQDVSVGAALGLFCWWRRGQHVGGRGRLLQWRLASLEPGVYQGHKEEHHGPHHRRHPSQREGHCVVPIVIM